MNRSFLVHRNEMNKKKKYKEQESKWYETDIMMWTRRRTKKSLLEYKNETKMCTSRKQQQLSLWMKWNRNHDVQMAVTRNYS